MRTGSGRSSTSFRPEPTRSAPPPDFPAAACLMADRYAEIFAAHRWNVPPQFNIAQACCARWANDRSRIALHWEDESGATAAFTFSDLQQQANRLSNALAALGIGRGDKIALILPQRPETVVAHLAAYQLGAIAVPLSFL